MTDRPAGPPVVDVGEPGSFAATVLEALAPAPGRLRSAVLVLVPMLVVLLVWEVFRLPQPGIAIFLLLVIARPDAVTTVGSSVRVGATVSLGALVAIVVLALSLGEPALRIPLMALMTFTTMLLLRGTTLGPAVLLVGFFATNGTTEADNLAGLALSTGDVVNTVGDGRPEIDYFPPEEALLHALLWFAPVAAVPAMLLAVAEKLAGADPRVLLLGKLRARAEAVAGFCRGAAGAPDRLRALAREGIAPLLDLMTAAERAHGAGPRHEVQLRLARGLDRLVLLMLAWDTTRPDTTADRAFLHPVGDFVGALAAPLAAAGVRRGRAKAAGAAALPSPPPSGAEGRLGSALPSLAAETRTVLADLGAAEAERRRIALGHGKAATGPRPILQPNGFGPDDVRFALKVTLAVMICYVLESGLDWGGISSAVVPCFMVALGTIGETVHKLRLRIVGCLIGAMLGIGAILFVMPLITGFVQLALLFGPVGFASAWIAFGSPRIAYVGWQILLAFALTTLQGYGPTVDMQTARDRIVGILLGNVVVALVFLFVWPVRVGDAVRRDMAGACDALRGLVALGADDQGREGRRAAEAPLRDRFVAALARVGAVIPNDRFEPLHAPSAGAGRIGRGALARLARLLVPVSVLATDGLEPLELHEIPVAVREEVRHYHRSLADWFGQAANWIRTGAAADELRRSRPEPPRLVRSAPVGIPSVERRVGGRDALYALLTSEIDAFLDDVLPRPAPRSAPAVIGRDASLAAG